MKMTFTDLNGTYTVERECGETVYDIFEDMIIPTLLAAGYSKETIDNYLDMGEGK